MSDFGVFLIATVRYKTNQISSHKENIIKMASKEEATLGINQLMLFLARFVLNVFLRNIHNGNVSEKTAP